MARETFSLLTWPQRLFVLLFTLVALSVGGLIWWRAQTANQQNAEVTFESQVDKMASGLVDQFAQLSLLMDGAAAFWETNPRATQAQWKAYLDRLSPWEKLPGLDAMIFAVPVKRVHVREFEARMRNELAPDFKIQYRTGTEGANGTTDLIVITHFEPYVMNRSLFLGFDMGGEIRRASTAEQARDTAKTVLSYPLQLVTGGSKEQDSFVVFSPVYRAYYPLMSLKQRRMALFGWVVTGLHGVSMAQQVFSDARAQGYDIALTALDMDGTPVPMMPSVQKVAAPDHVPMFKTSRRITMGGKPWVMTVRSTPHLERQLGGDPWSMLIVDLLLALTLSAGCLLLLISRQQSRLLATQVMRRLDAQERHYQSVVEGTAEGYWQIDPDTYATVAVNSSLCRMLGYEREEIIGKTPADFCHPSSRPILEQNAGRLRDSQHRMYELKMVRKNGDVLFAHVAESTLRDEDGAVQVVFAMVTDITESIRLREALTEQTRALEASNSDLKQFAYVASHDLQAPLRMVSSYLQLLTRRYSDQLDDEAREFIGFAVDGAHRMSRLINDLLSFSRLETRGGQIKPVSARECVVQALENLSANIESIGATVNVPASMPVVMGDLGQLVSLFQNLIGNAIKYAAENRPPVVTLSAVEEEGRLHISVADNGIGIPTDQYDRIFLIFQRLHGPDKYEGTGIGLALCKRIIERHSGKIWVTPNRGEGGVEQGSVFHVLLPMPGRFDDIGDDTVPAADEGVRRDGLVRMKGVLGTDADGATAAGR